MGHSTSTTRFRFWLWVIQVIGVVKDAKYKSLRETTRRAFYVSYFQTPAGGPLTFLLRTTGNPAGFGRAIRSTKHSDRVRSVVDPHYSQILKRQAGNYTN